MAIKPALTFVVPIKGDGTSTSVSVDLILDPVFLTYPGSSVTPFDVRYNPPTSAVNVVSQVDGSSVTASISGRTLSLTFGSTTAADTGAQGTFLFN